MLIGRSPQEDIVEHMLQMALRPHPTPVGYPA